MSSLSYPKPDSLPPDPTVSTRSRLLRWLLIGLVLASLLGAGLAGHWQALLPGLPAIALAGVLYRQLQAQRRWLGASAPARSDHGSDSENEENQKIRHALDVSSTAVMIADREHVIRYLNGAMRKLLRNQQQTLRQRWPQFDVDRLEGTSIHQFHTHPERIRGLLDQLRSIHHGKVSIGPVQSISPWVFFMLASIPRKIPTPSTIRGQMRILTKCQ